MFTRLLMRRLAPVLFLALSCQTERTADTRQPDSVSVGARPTPAVLDTVSSDWRTYHGDGFTLRFPSQATLVSAESHPSGMLGTAIQGPNIRVAVSPEAGPSEGPAYRLIVSSFPNPRGWSAEQWVDSLRQEANRGPMDADSLSFLAAPDTVMLGHVRALRLEPFCGDCEPEELYLAMPQRMVVLSYIFDISVPGDRAAQQRLYRAIAATFQRTD